MLSEKERGYLRDILRHIALAEQFTQDLGYESFRDDERTLLTTIRILEVISEASRRLPGDLKTRHADIPWKEMAAAGNFYRHNYEEVTSRRVWKTIREDVPPLRAVIEAELGVD